MPQTYSADETMPEAKAQEQREEKASGQIPATPAKTFTSEAGTLLGTAQTAPSVPQDINSVLQPYMEQFMRLGPEYEKEMQFLSPYLAPNQTGNLASAPAYTGPDASVVSKEQQALGQADAALGNAYQEQKPGFGSVEGDLKSYENTLTTQQPIQAALGFEKYLETYGGQPASTTGWSPGLAQAYKDILGGATSGGLTNPANAAAAKNTAQDLTGSTQATTAGPTSAGSG